MADVDAQSQYVSGKNSIQSTNPAIQNRFIYDLSAKFEIKNVVKHQLQMEEFKMKTFLIATCTLLSSAAMALDNFPDGKFSGRGRWKDSAGNSGGYRLTTDIANNVVVSKYKWDGGEREWTFEAKFDGNRFFPVLVAGKEVGQGYCYSVQCHYEVRLENTSVEETLTFVDGKLYRLGSKRSGDIRIAWEEELE